MTKNRKLLENLIFNRFYLKKYSKRDSIRTQQRLRVKGWIKIHIALEKNGIVQSIHNQNLAANLLSSSYLPHYQTSVNSNKTLISQNSLIDNHQIIEYYLKSSIILKN